MLKLLWRELNEGRYAGDLEGFYTQYDTLDRGSTSIRQNAVITLRVLLIEP